MEEKELQIRTSETGWYGKYVKVYRDKVDALVIDDGNVGFNPRDESLLLIGRKANLCILEWSGVLISLGVSGAGVWMIIAAIGDPEPTSKLSILLAGGVLCILYGGGMAYRVLTRTKPPTVEINNQGFRIRWD